MLLVEWWWRWLLVAAACASTVLSSSYDSSTLIQVNDPDEEYRRFFSSQPLQEEQWTLKVNTAVYGTDFIAFLATDNDRPLEYSCVFSTALCDFQVTKGSHDPETHKTVVYVHLKKPLLFASASMSGHLMACTGKADMLWKRPLIADIPILSLWATNSTAVSDDAEKSSQYFCQSLLPGAEKEVLDVPPSSSQGCSLRSYSCYPGLLVKPDVQAVDAPELEVHMWYMTKDNYREMREGVTTDVFVPVFPSLNYTLQLYATIANPLEESCHVTSPSQRRTLIKMADRVLNRLSFSIPARRENSGVYSVACSFQVQDQVAGMEHTLKAAKSLNITFIEGPRIVLAGQRDYTKYFPPNTSSTYILVYVYTTSPLVSFTVTSVSHGASNLVFPAFLSNSPYEILWQHNIRVVMHDYQVNGLYEIEVFNKDGELATQRFTIHKAKVLKMEVSPKHLAVEVGANVQFACAGIGNLVEHIQWARDIAELSKRDVRVVVADVQYAGEGSRGKRLTIRDVRLNDSGQYECTVSNRYQTLLETVSLVVWPEGGPHVAIDKENPRPFLPALPPSPMVLNITHDEIIRESLEYTQSTPATKRKEDSFQYLAETVVGVLAAIFILANVAICVFIAWFCRRHGQPDDDFFSSRRLNMDLGAFEDEKEKEGVEEEREEEEEGREKGEKGPLLPPPLPSSTAASKRPDQKAISMFEIGSNRPHPLEEEDTKRGFSLYEIIEGVGSPP